MELLSVIASPGEQEGDRLVRSTEIERHQAESAVDQAGEQQDAARLIACGIVIEEMFPTAKLRALATQPQELADQTNGRLPDVIVEVVPLYRSQQRHPPHAGVRQPVILPELLSLPEQRDALRRQQTDQVRLHLIPLAAVPL